MNQGNEAADQVLNMSLRSLEVFCRISGTGAKHLAIFVYTTLSSKKKTKGKARLETMLKRNEPLKVFSLPKEQLELFAYEAKRYGILYCVVKDKRGKDGMSDIIVRNSDASQIDRIVERFKLALTDVGSIVNEIDKDKIKELEKATEMTPDKTDEFINSLMEEEYPLQQQGTEKESQFANSSKTLEIPKTSTKEQKHRPSVRKQLIDINNEIEVKKKQAITPTKPKNKPKTKGR